MNVPRIADSRSLAAVALASVALGAAACAPEPPEEPILRPVRTKVVEAVRGGRTRTLSGIAQAGQETHLSFRVPGRIDLLSVRIGDRVETGQLIARLEQTDFQIAVRQAQASLARAQAGFVNSEADLQRARGLWETNSISQNELDGAEAQYKSARAAVDEARESLARAQRQVGYTELRAPVTGSIAEVPIEVNENVNQGQTVARLTSGTRSEVEVAVPGRVISEIHEGDPVTVTFSALPGAGFDAVVTEVGVAATGAATTFPVKVRLAGESRDVRPGMAAEVAFRFEDAGDRQRIFVPAHCVGEDREGRFVFVLADGGEPGVGVVRRTSVEVAPELTPEGMEILSGLSEGQVLVTAGVRRLIDGQEVKRLNGTGG